MMTETSDQPEGNAKKDGPTWGKFALPMLSGAVCGFVVVFIVMRVFDGNIVGDIGASAKMAVGVALAYICIGLGVGVGTASPAFGARFLNVEDADELREQRQGLIASALGMLTLGLALGVLAISGPDGPMSAQTSAIVAGGLILVGALFTVRSAKHSDELMRAVSNETGNVSYYLVFVILGGWAGLAHLGLVPAPAMLDVLSLLWILVLIAAFWVTGRRGMLNPR